MYLIVGTFHLGIFFYDMYMYYVLGVSDMFTNIEHNTTTTGKTGEFTMEIIY